MIEIMAVAGGRLTKFRTASRLSKSALADLGTYAADLG